MKYILILLLFTTTSLYSQKKTDIRNTNVSAKVRTSHNVLFKGYKIIRWQKIIINKGTYYMVTMNKKKDKGYIVAIYSYGTGKDRKVYGRLKNWYVI